MATKEPTLLQKLEKAMLQRKIEAYSRDSFKWLMNEGKRLAGASLRTTLMKEERRRALKKDPSLITIGSLVMYFYDAKHKDTLDAWDQFPVGFIIGVEKDRFQILNLHYLPPQRRAYVLQELLNIANNHRFDATTKLRLSYGIVLKYSKLKILKVCYHEYLHDHVKSKIIKIAPKDWEKIVYLPLQQFHKKSASQVWSDSIVKSNKPPKP
jgi:hypothetical protein